jgi:hypothetical protein
MSGDPSQGMPSDPSAAPAPPAPVATESDGGMLSNLDDLDEEDVVEIDEGMLRREISKMRNQNKRIAEQKIDGHKMTSDISLAVVSLVGSSEWPVIACTGSGNATVPPTSCDGSTAVFGCSGISKNNDGGETAAGNAGAVVIVLTGSITGSGCKNCGGRGADSAGVAIVSGTNTLVVVGLPDRCMRSISPFLTRLFKWVCTVLTLDRHLAAIVSVVGQQIPFLFANVQIAVRTCCSGFVMPETWNALNVAANDILKAT